MTINPTSQPVTETARTRRAAGAQPAAAARPATDRMQAMVYTRFGPPEVLQLTEVDKPSPQPKEVLIRIYATAVAAEDPGMRAAPGLNGILKPKRPILGFYLAGEVEAIGSAVTRFNPGDQVYGNTGLSVLGTYAEYVCLPEDGALAPMPANLSYAEAAAIPNGALTALPFLRDAAKLQRGQSVLIIGASGAVGSSAVQLAKAMGAAVTGVTSTPNLALVQSLGADVVIDYTTTDFTTMGARYDVIFDTTGKHSYGRCRGALTAQGVYITTVPTPVIMLRMLWSSRFGGQQVRFAATGLRPAGAKAADLSFVNGLIEAGQLKPVIDRSYPLAQMAEAHRYVAAGHKKGNVVITVA
ncbi:MAG: NAD(P)-dependent alcohol dehydrogenase [Anaerolineales bacterium]